MRYGELRPVPETATGFFVWANDSVGHTGCAVPQQSSQSLPMVEGASCGLEICSRTAAVVHCKSIVFGLLKQWNSEPILARQ
jgi:hypothetical protein